MRLGRTQEATIYLAVSINDFTQELFPSNQHAFLSFHMTQRMGKRRVSTQICPSTSPPLASKLQTTLMRTRGDQLQSNQSSTDPRITSATLQLRNRQSTVSSSAGHIGHQWITIFLHLCNLSNKGTQPQNAMQANTSTLGGAFMDHKLQRGVTTNGLRISKEKKDDTEKDLLEEPVQIFVLEPLVCNVYLANEIQKRKSSCSSSNCVRFLREVGLQCSTQSDFQSFPPRNSLQLAGLGHT